MAQLLTPENFTYESFRHSQGDPKSQVTIFGIFAKEYGIKPLLQPTKKEVRKYIGYISSSSVRTHVQYSRQLEAPGEEVDKAFEEVRKLAADVDPHQPLRERYDLLLEQLIFQESTLLHRYLGTPLPDTQAPHDRELKVRARLGYRVASGKFSFLHHFGLEGNSTHFTEFDDMYSTLARLYITGITADANGAEAQHQQLVSRVIAHSNKQ